MSDISRTLGCSVWFGIFLFDYPIGVDTAVFSFSFLLQQVDARPQSLGIEAGGPSGATWPRSICLSGLGDGFHPNRLVAFLSNIRRQPSGIRVSGPRRSTRKLVRVSSCLQVGPEGIEPTSFGLKGRCIPVCHNPIGSGPAGTRTLNVQIKSLL